MTENNGNGNGKKKPELVDFLAVEKEDKIKEALNCPTFYEIKIFAKAGEINIEKILEQIDQSLQRDVQIKYIRKRESKQGKYISYSISVYLEAYEDLLAIYSILKEDKTIIFYL